MKNRTIRVIIILVSMLFINIEAAQAGLVHKLKLYIRHEFPDNQFVLVTASIVIIGFLSYVLFAPVLIGKEKWAWMNYYSYQPGKQDYQSKRLSVKKISDILQNSEYTKQAHS